MGSVCSFGGVFANNGGKGHSWFCCLALTGLDEGAVDGVFSQGCTR